jgi:hypothetical protein
MCLSVYIHFLPACKRTSKLCHLLQSLLQLFAFWVRCWCCTLSERFGWKDLSHSYALFLSCSHFAFWIAIWKYPTLGQSPPSSFEITAFVCCLCRFMLQHEMYQVVFNVPGTTASGICFRSYNNWPTVEWMKRLLVMSCFKVLFWTSVSMVAYNMTSATVYLAWCMLCKRILSCMMIDVLHTHMHNLT